jgi:hypothetical protein
MNGFFERVLRIGQTFWTLTFVLGAAFGGCMYLVVGSSKTLALWQGIGYGLSMAVIFTPFFIIVSVKLKYADKPQFRRTLISSFHEIGYHITNETPSSIQLDQRLSLKLFGLNLFSPVLAAFVILDDTEGVISGPRGVLWRLMRSSTLQKAQVE